MYLAPLSYRPSMCTVHLDARVSTVPAKLSQDLRQIADGLGRPKVEGAILALSVVGPAGAMLSRYQRSGRGQGNWSADCCATAREETRTRFGHLPRRTNGVLRESPSRLRVVGGSYGKEG